MSRTLLRSLDQAVQEHVRPGDHLHFASLPFRSNAAVVQVAHAFRGRDPRFRISATGFHSTLHLLARLGLGRRYAASFFGDNHPTPRPNRLYQELDRRGLLEVWSLGSLVAALRAGALGLPSAPTRSLVGTDLGRELEAAGQLVQAPDPVTGERLAHVRAMRPDVSFVHAALGDDQGRLVFSPPLCEGAWGALAANRGVIATVERVAPAARLTGLSHLQPVPPHRVLAVCPAPHGAHPQPLHAAPGLDLPAYADDFEHYALWRRIATDPAAFAEFERAVLRAPDALAAYRSWVGPTRLACPPLPPPDPEPTADERALVERAAAHLAARVVAAGHRVILAGIGLSWHAALGARAILEARGRSVRILVEIGMYDVRPGTHPHPFLLAEPNLAAARRRTDVEDVLAASVCGAGNRCLGVVGAAQVDASGAINSTRLADGSFLVGSGGAADICAGADEVVVLTRSDRIVRRVDHVTSVGDRVRAVITSEGLRERAGPDAPWRASSRALEHT